MRQLQSDAVVSTVAFSPDGKVLTGVCRDSKLRQWDVASGALRKTIALGAGESVAALPAGSGLLAVSGKEGSIVLRGVETQDEVRRITGQHVRRVAFSRDGSLVAGGSRLGGNSQDYVMNLWDGAGKLRYSAPGGIGGMSAQAISPDGSVLAAASYDTNLRIWSTRNGELLRLIEDLPVAVFAMEFTPDGQFLVAAGVDRTVYFWETRTWRLSRKLTGQPEMINALAISADGRYLATGGFNDITNQHPVSVLLWDVASGKVIRKLDAPHAVSSVAFSPDGKILAVAAGEKGVRLWP